MHLRHFISFLHSANDLVNHPQWISGLELLKQACSRWIPTPIDFLLTPGNSQSHFQKSLVSTLPGWWIETLAIRYSSYQHPFNYHLAQSFITHQGKTILEHPKFIHAMPYSPPPPNCRFQLNL